MRLETLEFDQGIRVGIEHDPYAEAPYSGDDGVRIVLLHRRYLNPNPECGTDRDEVEQWIRQNRKDWFVTNLYMYEHSGIALAAGGRNPFHCPWDSGQVGIVALKKSGWGRGRGERNDNRMEFAQAVAEEYGRYMNGECYGYVIEDERGEQLDSCFGFIGLDHVIDEAGNAARHHVAQREREAVPAP